MFMRYAGQFQALGGNPQNQIEQQGDLLEAQGGVLISWNLHG
jgi:hypothetical protein